MHAPGADDTPSPIGGKHVALDGTSTRDTVNWKRTFVNQYNWLTNAEYAILDGFGAGGFATGPGPFQYTIDGGTTIYTVYVDSLATSKPLRGFRAAQLTLQEV
jgi:hypothetical protein